MYDNTDNPLSGIKAGVNPGFKVTSTAINEKNWVWEFSKGEFTTKFLGNFPYLTEQNAGRWTKINNGWGTGIVQFFKTFCDPGEVSEAVKKVSEAMNSKYQKDEQGTEEVIQEGAHLLLTELMNVANKVLPDLEWNLGLCYNMGIDKEGNDKYYLNIPLKNNWQDENGEWQNHYPFKVGGNPILNPNLLYKKPGEEVKEEEKVQFTPVETNPVSSNPADQEDW
jgi:hypothetical protein